MTHGTGIRPGRPESGRRGVACGDALLEHTIRRDGLLCSSQRLEPQGSTEPRMNRAW